MFVFQWNAPRIGDRVMAHDDLDPGFGLGERGVTLVRTRQPGTNEIVVRIDDRASDQLRPRRHAVHLVPVDARFACWRCEAMADSSTDGDHEVAA